MDRLLPELPFGPAGVARRSSPSLLAICPLRESQKVMLRARRCCFLSPCSAGRNSLLLSLKLSTGHKARTVIQINSI